MEQKKCIIRKRVTALEASKITSSSFCAGFFESCFRLSFIMGLALMTEFIMG